MGKKNILMLIGAVIFAGLVALLVAGQINKARRAGQDDIVEVAVAKVDLKWGTVLTKEMIDKNKFFKKSLPSQSYTDPSILPGRVLVTPIAANLPICEQHLAPITLKTGGVSAVISPDKRAIAVKVDKVIGVSGFIHPNNRVDVLVTFKRVEGTVHNPITKTILENILVLAVGPDIEEKKGKEQKATPVDVITLEVTPEEAEKIAFAAQEGKISLALRNHGDTNEVLTTGQTAMGLINSYSKNKAEPITSKPPLRVVRIDKSKKPIPVKKEAKKEEDKKEEKKEEKQKSIVIELIKGVKVTEVKIEASL